jgi:purine-binding chemotaxis protein CheW
MTSRASRETYTTFFVGQLLLGVPAVDVREVMKSPRVTPIPLASPILRGVFNARGELVTVIDLRCRLGLAAGGATPTTHVLMPTGGGTISLLVDREGDVMVVDRADFEAAPEGLAEAARICVVGAYKLADRLLIVLDSAKLLNLDECETTIDGSGIAGRMT